MFFFKCGKGISSGLFTGKPSDPCCRVAIIFGDFHGSPSYDGFISMGKSQSKMDKWFVYNGKSYKHGWELGVARWLRKPPYTGISKSWHEQIPVIVSLWRREARCKGSYRRVGFNYTNLFPDIQISGHISIFCWLHPRSQLIDHVTSLVNIWTLMAYTGPWTKTDTCLRTHGD